MTDKAVSNTPTTSNAELLDTHHGERAQPPEGRVVHKTEPPEPDPNKPADNRSNYQKIFGEDTAARLEHTPHSPAHPAHLTPMEDAGPPMPRHSLHMADVMLDIRSMMQAFGQDTPATPGVPDAATVKLRRWLIEEEVAKELLPAMDRGDLLEIADGIADAIVVLVGCALAYGIPLDLVWSIVHRSNMAKADPVTGKVRKREDGKVLKPDGWTPPTALIAQALGLPAAAQPVT